MRRVLAGLAVAATLASFTIFAAVFQPVQLLLDINQAPTPVSSSPTYLCESGGAGFLSGKDADEILGLWRTDGTSAGTARVASFGAAGESGSIECMYSADGLAFFQFTDQAGVSELWRSDGTSTGTLRLLRQPSADDGPIYFMGQSGLYAFMANDGVHGSEIMVTDGSVAGTRMLVDLTPGPDGSWTYPGHNVVSNGLLYFEHDGNLWTSDLTASGTHAVTSFTFDPDVGATVDAMLAYRGGVLFRYTYGSQVDSIYSSDGTNAGTHELTNFASATDPGNMGTGIVHDDLVLFTVSRSGTGIHELWTTDGTAANTRRLAGPDGDLDAGYQFNIVGSRVTFFGQTAATGRELWASDGTDAGTVLLNDFSPGPANSSITVSFTSPHYGELAVISSDGKRPIWITDGTVAGTRSVTDLDPSLASSTFGLMAAGFLGDDLYFWQDEAGAIALGAEQHNQLWRYTPTTSQLVKRGSLITHELSPLGTVRGQRLLFTNDDPATGREPWVSDGSLAGTRLLANLAVERSNGSSDPGPFLAYDNVALFGATGSDGKQGLWRSDGTATGTTRLGDGAPVQVYTPYTHLNARLGNQLLYGGALAYGQWELWSTDGTAAGTHMVIDLSSQGQPFPGLWTSNPGSCGAGFATLNGKAYYGASPARVGTLFRSDGTEAGTQSMGRFPDPNLARLYNPSSQVCVEAAYKNYVYFTAQDPVSGSTVLWRNDGTVDGNTHFKTAGGRDLVIADPVVEIDSKLYFAGGDGVQHGLWSTEGDPASTVLLFPDSTLPEQAIGPIFAVGKTIYFTNCSGSTTVCRLYRTDGTVSGTFFLAVTDNDQWTQLAGNPVTFDGKLLFTGKTAGTGEEPWITDGTVAGTGMLRDIVPGTEGSSPSSAFLFNGLTYFYVTRIEGSYYLKDLWRTDGTPANTERANLMPQGSRVLWENAAVVGQRVLLAGDNDTIGNELWVVENEAPVASPDSASTTSTSAIDIDVAANDSDPDGLVDSSTLKIVQAPDQGTAVVSSGRIRYTPAAAFVGTATFTYAISDRQQRQSAPATVTVTVSAPPVPPAPPSPPSTGGGGGKGGGGSLDALLLGILGLLMAWRKRAGASRGYDR